MFLFSCWICFTVCEKVLQTSNYYESQFLWRFYWFYFLSFTKTQMSKSFCRINTFCSSAIKKLGRNCSLLMISSIHAIIIINRSNQLSAIQSLIELRIIILIWFQLWKNFIKEISKSNRNQIYKNPANRVEHQAEQSEDEDGL
jgi:hypothetical protein